MRFTKGDGRVHERAAQDALRGLAGESEVDASTMASGVPNALMRNSTSSLEACAPFVHIKHKDQELFPWAEGARQVLKDFLSSGPIDTSWQHPGVTFAQGSAEWIDQVVENVSPCKREEMISI